jgi:hypothetical protein
MSAETIMGRKRTNYLRTKLPISSFLKSIFAPIRIKRKIASVLARARVYASLILGSLTPNRISRLTHVPKVIAIKNGDAGYTP